MNRRIFVALTSLGLLAGYSRAQDAGKAAMKIGLLLPASELAPEFQSNLDSLRKGLRDVGWTEGKNLVIETRLGGPDPVRLRQFATQLAKLPVALIVAPGTLSIRAARDGAPNLPIVMVYAGDAVGAGFVLSLARPGGNLTGTSAAGEEVLAKQLELLSAVVPELKRVSVLMNPANPANGFFFDAILLRAKNLGLQLDRIDAGTEDELEGAIMRAKGGALVVLGDPVFGRYRSRVVELTLRFRVPTVFGGRQFVVAGGLMSYLSSPAWHWRTAASYVDKILQGTKPADIPVEQPTMYELIVNLRTAKLLGLTIPQSVLQLADEVIE